mmetsp:Transcript_61344/g.146114  ORF Transcript_61344/g.146114 Transcript_61344/m.146114 type:complete len:217 (+) Transcript_61344:680-1330(+)
MLQVLKWLLVYLRIEHIMHGVHLCLPVLLIHIALLLHLAHGVAVLLEVYLMRGTLYGQAIDLLTQLQDVSLVLTEATLDTTHAQIQGSQSPRGLRTSQLSLLLHAANLLKCLLLLLSNVVLEPRLSVCDISLKVASHHCNFVEAITERVLGCVQTLLRSGQILVGEVNASIQGIHSLIGITGDFCLGLFQVGLHCGDVVPHCGQDFIYLPAAGIDI